MSYIIKLFLNDFPDDKKENGDADEEIESSSPTFPRRVGVSDENNMNHIDVHEGDDDEEGDRIDEVFTQRAPPVPLPASSSQEEKKSKGSELYSKYIEISLKRALLETEKEVLFLAERSVQETPFEIQEAQEMSQVFRKDFVLPI